MQGLVNLGGFVLQFFRLECPGVVESLHAQGYEVYVVDGARIHDKASLFELFRTSAPWEDVSPIVNPKWAGFEDCLSSGLQDTCNPKVAIVWSGVMGLVEKDFGLLLETLEVLIEIAHYLRGETPGVVRKTEVRIVLLGEP